MLLYGPRKATSAALGPYFGHLSRLTFSIESRNSMLRRYATVAFSYWVCSCWTGMARQPKVPSCSMLLMGSPKS